VIKFNNIFNFLENEGIITLKITLCILTIFQNLQIRWFEVIRSYSQGSAGYLLGKKYKSNNKRLGWVKYTIIPILILYQLPMCLYLHPFLPLDII